MKIMGAGEGGVSEIVRVGVCCTTHDRFRLRDWLMSGGPVNNLGSEHPV